MADSGTLAARLNTVQLRIASAAERSGRLPEQVRLIAVTKTQALETIQAAYALGVRHFAENRVQEAREKIPALDFPDAHWELVGHLQSNKAKDALRLFERIQSVDSLRLAEELDSRAHATGGTVRILLEVNLAGEASKSGFAPGELTGAAAEIERLSHVRIEGLMTVAPAAEDPEHVRPVFRRLRDTLAELRARGGGRERWVELSMGMSDDFEVAIEEGATLVRLGRALFGERPRATRDVQ